MGVKEMMRNSHAITAQFQRWEDVEKELSKKIQAAHSRIHAYLCDNMNTPKIIDEIINLITECNKYMDIPNLEHRVFLLRKCAILICKFLRIFGVITGADDIGFQTSGEGGGGREEIGGPFVDAFAKFRDDVKAIALEHKNTMILGACDNARDVTLTGLGVLLKDKPADEGGFSWSFEDPAELQRQARDKVRDQKVKELNKITTKYDLANAEA